MRLDEARHALMDETHHTCVVFHCVSGRTRSAVCRNSCNFCFMSCIYGHAYTDSYVVDGSIFARALRESSIASCLTDTHDRL